MQYELKVLEQIISVVLNPTRMKQENLHVEFMSEVKLHADHEKERIRSQFRMVIFGEYKPGDLELYYQKHQAILVELADIAYNYLQQGTSESIYSITDEDPILNFYREIAKIPEDLLEFIEKNFTDYFNRNNKIPDAKRWMIAAKIKRSLGSVRKGLIELEVDMELIKLACQPMEDYLMPEVLISYSELEYLLELQKELIAFYKKEDKSNASNELCTLLLQLNFNSAWFLDYHSRHLEEKGNGFNTLPELIEYHALQLKIINQLPARPGLIYKPAQPPIREKIGTWISEELYFLEKKERLSYQAKPQNPEPENEQKLRTTLSVSHLAFALKLLVESGMITHTNSTELMRMVARNFRTDRQEIISEESLRNKYYHVEKGTAEKMKELVIGLMNQVMKY